jgi:hypothetical protein
MRPFIGVATTTPIAIATEAALVLEPMNVLAEDGCGVPSDAVVMIGKTVSVAMRLSTAKRTIRCTAKVLGDVATTPAGLSLRDKLGQAALSEAMSFGGSATAIVSRADLEKMRAAAAQPKAEKPFHSKPAPAGFCLRFVDLKPDDLALVQHHIRASRELEAKAAIGNAQASMDRKIGLAFDDPKLSQKASDW